MCCYRIQTIPEWNRANNGWLEHNIIHVSNDTCLVLDSSTAVCLKCNKLRILCCPNHCCSQETGTGYHSSTPGSPPSPRFFGGVRVAYLCRFLCCGFFRLFLSSSCVLCHLLPVSLDCPFGFLYSLFSMLESVQMYRIFDIFQRNITCCCIMILRSD